MRVFVVRSLDEKRKCPPGVFDELKVGKARIGWSWTEKLNLKKLDRKPKDAWDDDEQKAARSLRFLNDVTNDDILIYLNIPKYKYITVVKVTGPYGYSPPTDPLALHGDYRSFRPCSLVTSEPVKLPPKFSLRRLPRGRMNEIDDRTFRALLKGVPFAGLEGARKVRRVAAGHVASLQTHGTPTAQRDYVRYLTRNEIRIPPEHARLQRRFVAFLERRRYLDVEQDRGRVDVRFCCGDGTAVLAEIKPSTARNNRFAIRTAVGQLLEYRFENRGDERLWIVVGAKLTLPPTPVQGL